MFKVGDKVEYTNGYGVFVGLRTITDIVVWNGKTRYHITPTDTPWFPVPEHSLRKAGDATVTYKPIGFWAGNWDQLKVLEEEIGHYCEKLTKDQRNNLTAHLLSGSDNPGTVSEEAWGIFKTDIEGFSNALLNA